MLNTIITGDEMWVRYWTLEMKEASKQWKTVVENVPHRFKERSSAGKIIVTVFWDGQGILLIVYLLKGEMVN